MQDVAWVPSWFQNLRTDGFSEYAKESQALSIQTDKVGISLSKFTSLVFCFYNYVKERNGTGLLGRELNLWSVSMSCMVLKFFILFSSALHFVLKCFYFKTYFFV